MVSGRTVGSSIRRDRQGWISGVSGLCQVTPHAGVTGLSTAQRHLVFTSTFLARIVGALIAGGIGEGLRTMWLLVMGVNGPLAGAGVSEQ